jgi:ArsR family transcriptional regulator
MKTKACGKTGGCAEPATAVVTAAASPAKYRARAEIVKALAHPTRLMMADRLAAGECCVCELQALAGADMSTVSKHLAVLKKAGIVEDEKRGLKVFYRLCCPCLGEFFGCIEGVLRRRAEALSGAL